MAKHTLESFLKTLRDFNTARDWQKFHTPKNLAMATASEAGELLALFRWLTEEQSRAIMADPKKAKEVRGEVADILAFLLEFCDATGIDILDAAYEKMQQNELNYPVALSRGHAEKPPRPKAS